MLIFPIVSGSILFVFPSPDMSAEDILVQRIAEMSVKLQHIDTLNDQRKLDLQSLSRDFTSFLKLVSEHQNQFENNNSSLNKKLAEYSKHGETEILIKTFSPLSSTLLNSELNEIFPRDYNKIFFRLLIRKLQPNLRSESSVYRNISSQHSCFAKFLHSGLQNIKK